jgi:hypothetical protein
MPSALQQAVGLHEPTRGHAYRGGGAVHPVEGALGPDRITAAAHALGVLGVEPTAGVPGSLREQHRAGRWTCSGSPLAFCSAVWTEAYGVGKIASMAAAARSCCWRS